MDKNNTQILLFDMHIYDYFLTLGEIDLFLLFINKNLHSYI